MNTTDYARWFRGSTPYISAHRNRTFVVLLTGEALEHTNLTNIVHDLALLHVLGVRLVLVHGARPQINRELADSTYHNNQRITDAAAVATIAGVHGQIRARLEALFSTGLPNSPMHNVDIPVISGNFVVAHPLGIIDGIDHQFTGELRRVERARVQATLGAGALVLQSPMGYSTSGQAFNLAAETLAAEMAIQLQADKLIVFDSARLTNADGARISTFTPTTLDQYGADAEPIQRIRLGALSRAVRGGVKKAHLISFEDDGALLAELFTADGVGTQVVEQARQPVRPAQPEDVAGIVEIIRPLEETGVLVRRERDRLEQELDHFLVAELDGIVVGCCAVYPYTEFGQGELACVAVHENYRNASKGDGIGQHLLTAAEARAAGLGLHTLFALTTQTTDWFAEQGFSKAAVEDLPQSKQSLYNWQRNSVVMVKPISAP